MFLLLVLCAVFFINPSDSCLSSGQPQCVCCPSCGGCSGGGGNGGGCLQRVRAASSGKTLGGLLLGEGGGDIDDRLTPNDKFVECCRNFDLPASCMDKCSYQKYTKEALLAMFLRTDECPVEVANVIQFCAAQGRDHSVCCARNGVASTLAGHKCLTFCDQRPGNVTRLDLSYVPCFERFDSMKECFWTEVAANPKQQQQLTNEQDASSVLIELRKL